MARVEMIAAPPAGRAEQNATRVVFFIAGFGVAAWAPLVPFAKARAGLDDGALGVMLLCLGVGSILTMPLAGALAARLGCRRVMVAASIGMSLVLPLLAALSDPIPLAIALFLFGASLGALDCVANIQAIIVERASGRAMMSGFHGLFSVGGIAGAGGMSALLSLNASPLIASLCVAAIIIALLFFAAPASLPYGSEGDGPAFAIPRGVVLFIGMLCFIMFLAEGAMLDWSAVFLREARGVDPSFAGLGYAAFAATMTAGRLTGDRIVQRLGQERILLFGGLLAGGGFALATLVPSWLAALAGYALVGAGCSNIVPVLFTAVGRQQTMPEHVAVPAITTLGYAGILAGPALIGFAAHATSLSIAMLGLASLLFAVAASSRFLRI
jgi:predicted MFS family arabinose efflux permease